MSTILYEKKDGIGYITLNRPEELNAVNDEMFAELDRLLPQIEMDLDVKVVIFRGAGKDFCAGQDLTGVKTYEVLSEPGEHMTIKKRMEAERRRNRRWEYIFNLAKPTIAQVHGHCLGTGCYLAMVCDITIAAEDAQFGDPLLRMGLLPHMPLWLYLVGIKRTREMLFTGCYIDGIEAEKIRIIRRDQARRLSCGFLETADIKGGEVYIEDVLCGNVTGAMVTIGDGCEIRGVVTYSEKLDVRPGASLRNSPVKAEP